MRNNLQKYYFGCVSVSFSQNCNLWECEPVLEICLKNLDSSQC